jgi:hypothetical protein
MLSAMLRTKNVLGWPKICKLVHAFVWEYSYKWPALKLD